MWTRRKHRGHDDGHEGSGEFGAADTQALADTVARHFESARVVATTVEIPALGLTIDCEVARMDHMGEGFAASLFLALSSPAFGDEPVWVSISGYGASPAVAVVEGACLWCCSFGPVLRSALTDSTEPDVVVRPLRIGDSAYLLHLAALDRMMGGDGSKVHDVVDAVRRELAGDPLLLPDLVASGTTPPPLAQIAVLSLFVFEAPSQRTVEIKISGHDLVEAQTALTGRRRAPSGDAVLLREFGLLVRR